MSEKTISIGETDPSKARMTETFPECESLTGYKKLICRNESGLPLNGPHSTNAYRLYWGLDPIGNAADVHKPEAGNIKRNAGERKQTYSESDMPCPHRGKVIRQDESNLCGSRGKQIDIYSCSVHGECSLGRYCKKQKVQTCVMCQTRMDASLQEPSSASEPE